MRRTIGIGVAAGLLVVVLAGLAVWGVTVTRMAARGEAAAQWIERGEWKSGGTPGTLPRPVPEPTK